MKPRRGIVGLYPNMVLLNVVQVPARGIGMKRKTAKDGVLNRLKRIEGQVRGITGMVEDNRYCIDVLTQIQAVRAALARVETEMLKTHLHHCIEGAIVSGRDRKSVV